MSGRISVHYKDLATDHEETLHGRFEWTETGVQVELALLDPLGQSVALLTAGSGDVPGSKLTLRDGKEFFGSTPEDLSEQALGWRLPLSGLHYWLDAQPRPTSNAPAATRIEVESTAGEIPHLTQDNWTIRYPSWQPGTLPKRVDLDYPGPPVLVEIRLVIDERSPGAVEVHSAQAGPQTNPQGKP